MQVPGSFSLLARGGQCFDLRDDLACRGELDGVLSRLTKYLAQPGDIAEDVPRHSVVDLIGQVQFFLGGLGGQNVERIFDAGPQIEGLFSSSSLPDSILEKSRMSLVMVSRASLLS